MSDGFFQRQAVTHRNELRQSMGALMGILQGVLADGALNDQEVHFLRSWLAAHDAVRTSWPGTVLFAAIEDALRDGVLTAAERENLALVARRLGEDEDSGSPVAALALDQVSEIELLGRVFCFTGDFYFGSRGKCQELTEQAGGQVVTSVSKKLYAVVVGGLGSSEWAHGSFGTKLQKAMDLKAQGVPLLVVHEDVWASSVMARRSQA